MDEYIRLVNKTEDYIESHLSEKISLDDLANNVNMSKYHFHRLFRKYSDETVKQFVTRIKVERSGIFLAVRNDLSITDIALQYGYNDAVPSTKLLRSI